MENSKRIDACADRWQYSEAQNWWVFCSLTNVQPVIKMDKFEVDYKLMIL